MMISEVKKERTAGTEDELRLEEEEKLKAERQLAQDEADMKAAVESLVKDENDGNLEDVKSADRQAAEDQYFRLTDERRRRLDEVGFVWCVRDSEKNAEPNRISRNSYDDQWDSMFLRLKEYKERHGHCLVPKRCKEDPKLGTWVDTQRVQYKKMRKKLDKEGLDYVPPTLAESILNDSPELNSRKPLVGRLTDDRIRRLEGLGFVWSLRDDWQKHYEELLQYKQEHGHCNVPARYASNRRLGIWVSAQRQQYKQISSAYEEDKPRRPTPLTQERIDQLNALGFTWTIRSRDNFGESWNQKFEELKEYRAQYGNCLVPSRYPPNPELGIWVGTQRTQYRLFQEAKESGSGALHGTSMNEDRIRQLEELGFVWALRNGSDTTWRKHINDLSDFQGNHGHCCVPAHYKRNPLLGEWAAAIRYAYLHRDENGLLDDEQVDELNSLGFSWLEPSPEFADTINNDGKFTIQNLF
jgi:Helicase associated domain